MGSFFKRALLFAVSTIVLLSIPSSASDNSIENQFVKCIQKTSVSGTISSTIVTAKNTSFEPLLHKRIDNRRYTTHDTPKPLLIIEPANASQVRATILCAKRHGLQIRTRSGGHDFEGIASVSRAPFVVLEMLNFRSIDIRLRGEESAWIGAGASLGELYYKIANESRFHGFPASVCPGVCAGGHISGGGYGNMMRMFGLSSDQVVDAEIMDANGDIRYRDTVGEDVFWALRGGGGGSFGVILAYKVNLVRVPEKVTVFNVDRSREQGSLEAMYRWQFVAPNLPNEVFIRVAAGVVNGSGNGNKTISVSFIGLYLGRSEELVSLLEKSFPELGLKEEECHEMSWIDSTLFWADHPIGTPREALLNRLDGATQFYKIKSDYVKKPIPKEGLESIWEDMLKIGQAWMKWNPYGGKMSEIPESQSPFPHRAGNLFLIQYYVYWFEEGDEISDKYISLARQLYEKMTPFVSENPREAFLNYRDLDIGTNLDNQTDYNSAEIYGRKYFKSNFERLVRAKTFIDPDNFFKNGQSIPPLSMRK